MESFIQNIKDILASPLSFLTLLAGIIILLALVRFRKIKLDAKLISRIGIALALSTILHFIRIINLPNGGGSITLGSMIPILIIAFMYGGEIGMLTGFLFGIIYLIISPYILHPIQVLFDYPLPFMAVGIAGYFKNNKYLGTTLGMLLRFFCHFISGVVFFGEFAPEGWSPILYSLIINGSMIGGELIVSLVLLTLIPLNRIIKATTNYS